MNPDSKAKWARLCQELIKPNPVRLRADTKAITACGLMGQQQMQQSEQKLLQFEGLSVSHIERRLATFCSDLKTSKWAVLVHFLLICHIALNLKALLIKRWIQIKALLLLKQLRFYQNLTARSITEQSPGMSHLALAQSCQKNVSMALITLLPPHVSKNWWLMLFGEKLTQTRA